MSIATALVTGKTASAELAAKAVQLALKKLHKKRAHSVLLYLSSEFAANPEEAIKAAAKAASTTQVMGCSCAGLFTEDDWVMDGAAAAVMVFTGEAHLSTQNASDLAQTLTLTAPSAINTTWLNSSRPKFGGVSGDITGQGAFSVWQNGKGSTQGYTEIALKNMHGEVAASHGLKLISKPLRITQAAGFDVQAIANISTLTQLESVWQQHVGNAEIAFHQLMLVHAATLPLIEAEQFAITPVITDNPHDGSVTVASEIPVGDWMAWAVRDADAAQLDVVKTMHKLKRQLKTQPDFALVFSSLGRGPFFYNGVDVDLRLIQSLVPDTPLIGFYGNGQIVPIHHQNMILPYSAVIGLFSENGSV